MFMVQIPKLSYWPRVQFFAVLLVGGFLLARSSVWADSVADDDSGFFSEAQAARGQALFDEHCPACHGAQLQGAAAVALTGPTFQAHWADGQHTVDDLFYIVRTQMPYTEPGKLSRQQYIDIIAYVLKVNSFPAGDRELPATPSHLKKLVLQAK
jgi:S-disulfanyl-L-cysteine oxidoreductase SoxD